MQTFVEGKKIFLPTNLYVRYVNKYEVLSKVLYEDVTEGSVGENDWSPRRLASLLLDFSRAVRYTSTPGLNKAIDLLTI